MTAKQTAVEWLFEKVWITPVSELPKILEQAKEMEKQQIMNALKYANNFEQGDLNCEVYYNETFKNTEK